MSVRSGKASFDIAVYACLHVYGAYLIVGNKLSSGSFDIEVYVWVYIYGSIWLQHRARIYIFAYIIVGLS